MNEWGDVELDVRGMRALAHPVRVAILERLRAEGASTATRLAPLVGASPSVTSWHLRHLAEHGLVEDAPRPDQRSKQGRERWWQAVGRGFTFSGEADAASYAGLLDALEQTQGDLVERWRHETLPRLEPGWVAVAGRWNTRIRLTQAELATINAAIDELLTPYVVRDHADTELPADARRVRLLRYAMPAADGS